MSLFLGGTTQLPVLYNNLLYGIATSINLTGSGVNVSLDQRGNLTVNYTAGSATTINFQDEGVQKVNGSTLNVVGTGATLTDVGGVATLTVPGVSNTVAVQDEGSTMATTGTINFVGGGVGVSNVGGVATVNIPTPGSTLIFKDEGATVLTAGTLNVTGTGASLTNVGGVATLNISSSTNTIEFRDEGATVMSGSILNVTGSSASMSNVGGIPTLNITDPSTSFNHFENGTNRGSFSYVGLSGAGVSWDGVNNVYTIPGGATGIDPTLNGETMYNPKNPTYGANGTGGDDTAAIRDCINAAVTNLPATVWFPPGDYGFSFEVVIPNGDFAVPFITNANTSTGELTFSSNHGLQTGAPIMLQGFLIGSIDNGVVYIFRPTGTNKGYLYDTPTNATAGTTTGRFIPSTNVLASATIVGGSRTVSLTATAPAGVEVGTNIFISTDTINSVAVTPDPVTQSSGGFYVTAGVGTSTLSINNTVTNNFSGTVIFKTAIDWRFYNSGLKIVGAPGANLFKLQNYNTNTGSACLNIALGSNVHVYGLEFNGLTRTLFEGITASTTASSAVITVNTNKGLRVGDKIVIPNAKLVGGQPGNVTQQISAISGTSVTLATICDFTVTAAMTRAIVPGDDGIRIASCHRVVVERCKFNHFGDSALRLQTNVRDPLAKRTSDNEGGVNSGEVTVRDNYFYNIHQTSTTTNDFVHGGARNIQWHGNQYEYMWGSAKFANRVPGGRNLRVYANSFKKCFDKGLEIDSMDTVDIFSNTFRDVLGYTIYMLPNNGPAGTYGLGIVGFQFNNLKVHHNIFTNCGSAGGTIRLQPDLYQDGSRFEYNQVDISNNDFTGHASTSVVGLNLVGGSYQQLNFNNNKFKDWAGTPVKAALRGSTTVDFVNSLSFESNMIDMSYAGNFVFDVRQTSGTEMVNLVNFSKNKISGTCNSVFLLDGLKNVVIEGNHGVLAGGSFMVAPPSGTLKDVEIRNNIMRTGGTLGWSLAKIAGLNMFGNQAETASGTAVDIQNSCSAVWYINNQTTVGGNLGGASFAAVPVNTKALNKTGRRDDGTGAPTSGTWRVGDIVDFNNAAAAGAPATYCITSGTAGTIPTTTATTNGTTNVVTFSTVAGLAVGCFITIAGVSGVRAVTVISGLTATVDGAVPAAVGPGAAVAYSAPVFKTFAALAA